MGSFVIIVDSGFSFSGTVVRALCFWVRLVVGFVFPLVEILFVVV